MQKKILVILALAHFISVGTSSAYAENSTHEQVLMQYLGDPMFVSHLEYDYESAMEMIDNIILFYRNRQLFHSAEELDSLSV